MGLFDSFYKNKKDVPSINGTKGLRIELINCDYAPDDMEDQLPITICIIRQISGSDTDNYWLAKSEKPIKYKDKTIEYVVVGCRFLGITIKKGIGRIALNVAYVIDESLVNEDYLDFSKCDYVAICDGLELDEIH